MGASDSDGFKMRLWFWILSLFFLVSSSNAFFNLLFGFGGRGNRGRRPASSYGAPSRPSYNARPSYNSAPTYNAPSKPSYNSPSSSYGSPSPSSSYDSPSPSSSYDSPSPSSSYNSQQSSQSQRELPTPPQISYGGFQAVQSAPAQSSYNSPAPAQSSYNSPVSSPAQSSGDSYGSPAAPAQSSYNSPSQAAPVQATYSVAAAQPNYGK